MNCNEYIENRVNDQIKYYETKSIKYQKTYKNLKTVSIIFTALIPIFVYCVKFHTLFNVAIIICSSSVAVIESILYINKYNELWINYRSVCQRIIAEKMLFLTCAGNYKNKENDFSKFANNIETILANETNEWTKLNERIGEKTIEKNICEL